jgi:hypothetical protein
VPIQEALLKMSMYVSLVLIVPGPTNTLLLSSGLKVGVRGTWPLVRLTLPLFRESHSREIYAARDRRFKPH